MATKRSLQLDIDSRGAVRGAQQFDRATDQVERSAKKADRSTKKLDRSMVGVAKSARGAYANFVLLGGAIAAGGIAKGVKTAADFELQMLKVKAVTGATAAEQLRLESTARKLGSTTRFTASQAGSGLLFLARAGFTTEESIAALPATLQLATAAEMELGVAADVASNVLSQFGLKAGETVRVVDALVAVSNRSNTSVDQLAEAMKLAGPVAGAMGIEVEETAIAIGVLGDSGIQASLAGTNLRGTMSALLAPTTAAKDAMKDMGVELDAVNPAENGIIDAFVQFAEAELSAADAVQIFGRRNAAAALVLSRNIDRLQELRSESKQFAGEAADFTKTIDDSFSGSWNRLKSAIEGAGLSLDENFGTSSGIRGILDKLAALANFTGLWADEMEKARKEGRSLTDDLFKKFQESGGLFLPRQRVEGMPTERPGDDEINRLRRMLEPDFRSGPPIPNNLEGRPGFNTAGLPLPHVMGDGKEIANAQAEVDAVKDLNKELKKTSDTLESILGKKSGWEVFWDDWKQWGTDSAMILDQTLGNSLFALEGAVSSLVRGHRDWKEASAALFDSVSDDMTRITTRLITIWLLDQAISFFGGSAVNSNQIPQGHGTVLANTSIAPGQGTVLADFPLKASGGGVFDGPMSGYPVILHGREEVNQLGGSSGGPGRRVGNAEGGGGGGPTIIQNFYISATDAASFDARWKESLGRQSRETAMATVHEINSDPGMKESMKR